MPNGKLIRGLAALVMILALVLPVSPGFAAEETEDGAVQAAHLTNGPGGSLNSLNTNTFPPVVVPTSFATYDRADCPPVVEGTSPTTNTLLVGQARYVITVDNADTSTAVQLIGTGAANLNQIITLTRGDFEGQAYDGTPCFFDLNCPADLITPQNPAGANSPEHLGCRLSIDRPPTPADGHVNDFATPGFVGSHNPTYQALNTNGTLTPAPPAAGSIPNPALAGVSPGSTLAADTWTWDLVDSQNGFTPRRFNLSRVTDNLGVAGFAGVNNIFVPAAPLTPTPACGTDNFACNIGLGTIIMTALTTQSGFGTVNGIVTDENNLPLPEVTVVLTDVNGSLHTTVTNANGFYSFPSTFPQAATTTSPFLPAVTATNGDFIPAGTASIVFADNINDYSGCAPGANCGHQPAALTITVPNGTPVAANIQLLNLKAAPVAAEATLAAGTVGVFGYAVSNKVTNNVPAGVGGVRVDAFLGTTATGTPVQSVLTDPGTGRWRMVGLTAATTYTFVASLGASPTNMGVSPLTCATAAGTPAEVTPANPAVGITVGTCTDTLTTGAAGTWADPVFVIATPNPFPVAVPPPGTGFISGVITDSQGLPVGGTTVTLYQLSSGRTWATQTLANGQYFFGQLAANPSCVTSLVANLPAALGSSGCAGLPFDTYTVTAIDTRFPEQCAAPASRSRATSSRPTAPAAASRSPSRSC